MISQYSLKLTKDRKFKYSTKHVDNHIAAAAVFRDYLGSRDCEHLAMILLDGRNMMTGLCLVGIGFLHSLPVSIRNILKFAVIGNASGFVIGHNHPSGNVSPSVEDLVLTNKLMEACDVVGIPMLDHIIVSSGVNDATFSFAENNVIRKII